MNLLEAIRFILNTHDETGFDHEGIGRLLSVHGIGMPCCLVQGIIDTMHYNPTDVKEGPIYDVNWSMSGFQIIMDGYFAGTMSVDIITRLKEMNYNWDHDFVCMIMFAEYTWLQSGNGNSW